MTGPTLPASPESVLGLTRAEADALLTELESFVPRHRPFVTVGENDLDRAIVFGDTHGDWRSAREVVARFEAGGPRAVLVGLGDYVDRVPSDCGAGSAANALFLLSVAARAPGRVFLLQGNHETARRIGVRPHDLPGEIGRLWGPGPERYERLMGLLERGPIAAATTSGAYLAHAGFPRRLRERPWTRAFERVDDRLLAEIVWAECEASQNRRGAADPWGSVDLERFLGASGLSMMLRGHDPDLAGRPLYGDRVVTLHTTRYFEQYGGVLVAELPLGPRVRSSADVTIVHLPSEGRTFPPPGRASDGRAD